MAGNELQKAIDDLRARIRPENLPYVEALARGVDRLTAENSMLWTGVRSMVAVGRDLLTELPQESHDAPADISRQRIKVDGPSLGQVASSS